MDQETQNEIFNVVFYLPSVLSFEYVQQCSCGPLFDSVVRISRLTQDLSILCCCSGFFPNCLAVVERRSQSNLVLTILSFNKTK